MSQYSGVLAAAAAYGIWGFMPIYWKALTGVPAEQILCHRMVWSLAFTLGLIAVTGRMRSLLKSVADRKSVVLFSCASALLAVNWLLFIWSVNAGYVIEASLGYFINPLIAVAFGVVFIGEKLRRGQWAALVLALIGVLYLTFWYGQFPWIALTLATTFALYGLLHKKTSLPALEGLSLETLVLFMPALAYLAAAEATGEGAFLHGGMRQTILLSGTGLVTSLPLLLFGFAARRIPLSTLGLLQYIAPTINLFLGILLYNEPFPPERMIGFMIIWCALLMYLGERLVLKARQKRALA